MLSKDTPIQQKLMTVMLLTSGAVLLLMGAAYFAYDLLTFRQTTVRQLSTLGQITATNSTAALAFVNQDDAQEVLAALKAEPRIVAASLYDIYGKPFATYPKSLPPEAFPTVPARDGYRFGAAHLLAFYPVMQGDNRRLGTLYLKFDMGAIHDRFRLYGGIAIVVIIASFLFAYLLSKKLQQQISKPILALTETARAISDHRDYAVRAVKRGEDEVGLLTDAFNHMLTQIQAQNLALSASEARVRVVLNAALSAVVVMDAAGKITDWNAQAEAMFGWTYQEALGQEVVETIIPLRYREAHRHGIERLLATGQSPVLNRLFEITALRRDGSEFPVELSVSPLHTGEALAFCGFITDITERKQSEAALRESQEHYRALAESLPHLVWTCAPDGPCDYLSHQWVEYTGRVAEEQLGYGWVEQLHPEDRERAQTAWAEATRRGDQFDIEFRIRRADGVYRWFKTRAVPLRDTLGRLVKWFGSNTDVEDYKQAEQRLQTQLERMHLLYQITHAIGERQDLQSIFQVVVRSLEDDLPIDFGCVCLYDMAQAALTVTCIGSKSQPLARELAMTDHACIAIDQNGLSRCVRGQLVYEPDTNRAHFPFSQRLTHGGLRSLVVAPLLVESKVFGVLVAARRDAHSFSSADCEFLRQLSEHVALAAHQAQLYEALQQAYDDLRQTQQAVLQQERLRALGQMASGIAHDINNAVSPVALYTESLLENEPNLSARARGYLETMQHAINDVAATVARMREFYRQREEPLMLTPVLLNRLVQQVIDLTRARWVNMPQKQGIMVEVRSQLTSDLPAIMGVESEIREALTNLIFNAVDAMPEGGTLTLRTQIAAGAPDADGPPTRKQVQVELTDTGIGMDEETRRRCLEPFFTTKGERGTGLGLAMVYGIMQRHSAEIEIDSAIGKGTTVRLSFPVPAGIVAEPAPSETVRSAPWRVRVLVVDDDPLVLQSLHDTLEIDGHLVTTANGGQAGIEAFCTAQARGEPFAMVITDLGMPHVDGRQVASAVKGTLPNTPVILLTGWGQRLVADGDVPPHVDRVLNKPPKLRELREVLAHYCQPKRS
jgi:PAS domain S-box-containing protein